MGNSPELYNLRLLLVRIQDRDGCLAIKPMCASGIDDKRLPMCLKQRFVRVSTEDDIVCATIDECLSDLWDGAVGAGDLQAIKFQHTKVPPKIATNLAEILLEPQHISIIVSEDADNLRPLERAYRRPRTVVSQMNDGRCPALCKEFLRLFNVNDVLVGVGDDAEGHRGLEV